MKKDYSFICLTKTEYPIIKKWLQSKDIYFYPQQYDKKSTYVSVTMNEKQVQEYNDFIDSTF